MTQLERPKIKDYFKKGTTIDKVAKAYQNEPELFKYTQAVDKYADQLESERDELKLKEEIAYSAKEIAEKAYQESRQELQTLKDAVKEKTKAETDMFASVFKNDKERHEAERVVLKAEDKLKELIK